MKKISFVIIFFISSAVLAQSASQVGWVSKFGLAGGFSPVYMFPNVDELNVVANDFGVGKFSTSGLITYGGGGYAYIMFINNVRIGGIGFSGWSSQSSAGKEVEYGIGGGALTIEYTIPQIKRIAVSLGLMLGRGSIDINIYDNNGSYNWSDTWADFSSPNKNLQNSTRRLSNSYWTISPTLNVDIPITRFLAVRLGGGYQLTFGDEWEVDNGQKLSGVPDDLNGNAFFLQTGIFLGFFAF
jgi:hypothetical protein